MIGHSRLSAEIKDSNIKSLHIFEGLGFVKRDFRDGFYYLTRDQILGFLALPFCACPEYGCGP